MLVRRLASVNTGAFRFLGKDFETIAGNKPPWPATKFLFDKFICAIGLIWIDDMAPDRVSH